MSTDLSPRPERENAKSGPTGNGGGPSSRRKRRRSGHQEPIPSAEDCMRLLHRLGGMVAVRLIDTRQAGVMRAIYQTILQHHQRNQASSSQHAFDVANIMDKLRGDPDLVNHLAPFLTADQLAELLHDPEEGEA